jgi:hypothetical protein
MFTEAAQKVSAFSALNFAETFAAGADRDFADLDALK